MDAKECNHSSQPQYILLDARVQRTATMFKYRFRIKSGMTISQHRLIIPQWGWYTNILFL